MLDDFPLESCIDVVVTILLGVVPLPRLEEAQIQNSVSHLLMNNSN